MATHSSILAWRIPETEEPSRLPSMGSHRVGHDCSDLAAAAKQEYGSGSLFPSPVDHVLSDLSTMTCPFWVVLRSMAHCFIELDKAVHVIRLVSFLWLWFSVCLPSDGEG